MPGLMDDLQRAVAAEESRPVDPIAGLREEFKLQKDIGAWTRKHAMRYKDYDPDTKDVAVPALVDDFRKSFGNRAHPDAALERVYDVLDWRDAYRYADEFVSADGNLAAGLYRVPRSISEKYTLAIRDLATLRKKKRGARADEGLLSRVMEEAEGGAYDSIRSMMEFVGALDRRTVDQWHTAKMHLDSIDPLSEHLPEGYRGFSGAFTQVADAAKKDGASGVLEALGGLGARGVQSAARMLPAMGASVAISSVYAPAGVAFWYAQSQPEIDRFLRSQGVNNEDARMYSYFAAAPYALIEHLQVKQLQKGIGTAAFSKTDATLKNIFSTMALRYAGTVGLETFEEAMQEGIKISTLYLHDQTKGLDRDYKPIIDEAMNGLFEAFLGMMVLPVPGLGFSEWGAYREVHQDRIREALLTDEGFSKFMDRAREADPELIDDLLGEPGEPINTSRDIFRRVQRVSGIWVGNKALRKEFVRQVQDTLADDQDARILERIAEADAEVEAAGLPEEDEGLKERIKEVLEEARRVEEGLPEGEVTEEEVTEEEVTEEEVTEEEVTEPEEETEGQRARRKKRKEAGLGPEVIPKPTTETEEDWHNYQRSLDRKKIWDKLAGLKSRVKINDLAEVPGSEAYVEAEAAWERLKELERAGHVRLTKPKKGEAAEGEYDGWQWVEVAKKKAKKKTKKKKKAEEEKAKKKTKKKKAEEPTKEEEAAGEARVAQQQAEELARLWEAASQEDFDAAEMEWEEYLKFRSVVGVGVEDIESVAEALGTTPEGVQRRVMNMLGSGVEIVTGPGYTNVKVRDVDGPRLVRRVLKIRKAKEKAKKKKAEEPTKEEEVTTKEPAAEVTFGRWAKDGPDSASMDVLWDGKAVGFLEKVMTEEFSSGSTRRTVKKFESVEVQISSRNLPGFDDSQDWIFSAPQFTAARATSAAKAKAKELLEKHFAKKKPKKKAEEVTTKEPAAEEKPPEKPKGGWYDYFHEQGGPQYGDRGYRDALDQSRTMLDLALQYWEDPEFSSLSASVLTEAGQTEGELGEALDSLADLLMVPGEDAGGVAFTAQNRREIAEQVVLGAAQVFEWESEEKGEEIFGTPRFIAEAMLADVFDGRRMRIINVSKDIAQEFIKKHHSTHEKMNPRGIMYTIGLVDEGELVAVATIGTATRRAVDPHRILELTRVASSGKKKMVKGKLRTVPAASMLTARAMDLTSRSVRGGEKRPGLFYTYSIVGQDHTPYLSLKDKGLRPTRYVSGKNTWDGIPKIRWEYGPEAGPANWDLPKLKKGEKPAPKPKEPAAKVTKEPAAEEAEVEPEPAGIEEYEAGQAVEVHSFGRWYGGEVVKVGRKRVYVTYTTGTGKTRDKAFNLDRVRKVEPAPKPKEPAAEEVTTKEPAPEAEPEITDKSQIDSESRYTVWERRPAGLVMGIATHHWTLDRSYSGVYFKGEGNFYIESAKHGVFLEGYNPNAAEEVTTKEPAEAKVTEEPTQKEAEVEDRDLRPGVAKMAKPDDKSVEKLTRAAKKPATGAPVRSLKFPISVLSTVKTDKPIHASEVIAGIARIFGNHVVRFGRLIELGRYLYRGMEIRLKEVSGIGVYCHEVSHHLDDVSDVLKTHQYTKPLMRELAKLDYNVKKGRHYEGFAEYMRVLLTYGEQYAKQDARQFHAYFMKWLTLNPEWESKIEQSRNLIRAWSGQGHKNMARAARSTTGQNPYTEEEERKIVRGIRLMRQTFEDDLSEMERTVNALKERGATGLLSKLKGDPLTAARVLKGAEGILAEMAVMKGVRSLKDHRFLSGSLVDALKLLGEGFTIDEYEDFVSFIHARHSIDVWSDWLTTKVGDKFKGKILRESKTQVEFRFDNGTTVILKRKDIKKLSKGMDPGMERDVAETIFNEHKNKANWIEASDRITAWNKAHIEMMAEVGLISPETEQLIIQAWPAYIPLKRVVAGMRAAGVKSGFLGVGAPVRRLRGSSRQIIDPLTAMWQASVQMHAAAAKHKVANLLIDMSREVDGYAWVAGETSAPVTQRKITLGKLAEQLKKQFEDAGVDLSNADMDFMLTLTQSTGFYRGGEPIALVYRDGKPVWYQFNPEIFEAISGMPNQALPAWANMALWPLKLFTRAVRMGAVGLRAAFGFGSNPFRDLQDVIIKSEGELGSEYKTFFRTIGYVGLYGMHKIKEARGEKGDPVIALFEHFGGPLRTFLGQDIDVAHRNAQRLVYRAQGTKMGRFKSIVFAQGNSPANVALSLTDFVAGIFSIPELMPRLAEMQIVLEEAGFSKQDLADGKVPYHVLMKVVLAGNEATIDFSRHGTLMSHINRVKAFSNVQIQGKVQGLRKAGLWPGAFSKKRMAVTMIRGSAVMTVPTLLYWYGVKDEEWYKELPAWRRFFFWNFRVGDATISVPRAFEYGILFAAIPEAIADSWYRGDDKRLSQLVTATWKQEGMDAASFIPDALLLPLELMTDYDTWRDRPIEGARLKKLNKEDRYRWYTTGLSRYMGNYFKASPVKIDHAIYRSTGGIGTDILRVKEKGLFKGLLGFGRFSRPTERGESLDEFYSSMGKWEREYNSAGGAEKAPQAVKHRYLVAKSISRLMAEMRLVIQGFTEREKEGKFQQYLTGLARFGLQREELGELYPNPLRNPPPEFRPLVEEYLSKRVWDLTNEKQEGERVARSRILLKRMNLSRDHMRKLLRVAAIRRKIDIESYRRNAYDERLDRFDDVWTD